LVLILCLHAEQLNEIESGGKGAVGPVGSLRTFPHLQETFCP